MVTVVDYKPCENCDGKPFHSLVLEGDMEIVTSASSGRHYATSRKALMASTFSEERCKKLIGKCIPGSIIKVPCEPYDYTLPESGEVIQLTHTYCYCPEEHPLSAA